MAKHGKELLVRFVPMNLHKLVYPLLAMIRHGMKVKVTALRVHLYIGNWHTWQPELVAPLGYWKGLEMGGGAICFAQYC